MIHKRKDNREYQRYLWNWHFAVFMTFVAFNDSRNTDLEDELLLPRLIIIWSTMEKDSPSDFRWRMEFTLEEIVRFQQPSNEKVSAIRRTVPSFKAIWPIGDRFDRHNKPTIDKAIRLSVSEVASSSQCDFHADTSWLDYKWKQMITSFSSIR